MDRSEVTQGRVFDGAVALGFAVVGCAEALFGPIVDDVVEGPLWLNLVAVLAGTVPLAWRRVAPLWVALAVYGALAGRALADEPFETYPTFLAVLVATYTVASYAPLRDALLAAVVSGFAITVAVVRGSGTEAAPDPLAATILFGTVWLVGRVVGTRNERAAQLHADRDRHAAEAVALERARITQEMHDSVSHSLAAIVMQAGGAAHVLAHDPDRARTALESIERSARLGLDEMRRSLGLLGESEAELAPALGIDALDELIDKVRTAGVDVELLVEGRRRDVDPQVGAAAYRIVQEGLTNVMRHAGPCRAVVRLDYAEDSLEISVSDDGRTGPAGDERGRGLVGIRARAELLGGRMDAGARDPGFEVRVVVPA